ncbi:MAG: divergent PAP2 family protein [Rectinemataceae bacterium]
MTTAEYSAPLTIDRLFLHTSSVSTDTRHFLSLFQNPVFLSGAWSLFAAQVLKAIITLLKRRNVNAREIAFIMLWKTGGMPSSHSALVVSLSTSIALTEGFDSLFIVSFFLGLIVIRDALGVRRSAGLQSRALNLLGTKVSEHMGVPFAPVKEIHGHKWQEVLVGALLGLIVSIVICYRQIAAAVSASMP